MNRRELIKGALASFAVAPIATRPIAAPLVTLTGREWAFMPPTERAWFRLIWHCINRDVGLYRDNRPENFRYLV